MSSCRWSDPGCDLYCYEDANGYIVHVASKRRKHSDPEPSLWPPDAGKASKEVWQAHNALRDKWMSEAELVDIGLPHDGGSFRSPDLKGFLDNVQMLKDAGYMVPHWVLADIEAEIEDEFRAELRAEERRLEEGLDD